MSKNTRMDTDKAIWLVHVVGYTADELRLSVSETVRLLDENGLIDQVLSGYRSLHTQGYEYMAELLTDLLRESASPMPFESRVEV